MFIITIFVLILIFGILILSHEFGHFIVAKKNGVKVDEFAIGFPPRIFKVKKHGTLYSVNLIPLGGYVKEDEKSFLSKSIAIRAKVFLAGVAMNFILAVFLLTILSIHIYPWYKGFFMGTVNAFYILWALVKAFGAILQNIVIHGKVSSDIVGPVGIAHLMGGIISQGFFKIIYFISLISLNLAIINILPFPALDGGHLLFLFIEKIKGSPVSLKLQNIVNGIGFGLLILLMVAVTWRDVVSIIH